MFKLNKITFLNLKKKEKLFFFLFYLEQRSGFTLNQLEAGISFDLDE
jgi:hypothetical protein